MRKLFCLLLALMLSLLAVLPLQASAEEDVNPYIARAMQYYEHYQEDAWEEIDTLLARVASIDPAKGELWRRIFRDWSWCNTDMPIYEGVLPDGLAQDDSLCIVILGYALNSDGTMQEELLKRLEVGLASAQKYPYAYIAVCGGGTAGNSKATEADTMAAWLMEQGIPDYRIIIENKSMSTTENAKNLYGILYDAYPSVTRIALATSDYHLPWAASSFLAGIYRAEVRGNPVLELVGNAAAKTDQDPDTMFSQAWGIAVMMDVPYGVNIAPAMYVDEEETEYVPEPVPTTLPAEAPVPEEKDRTWMVFPAAMVVLAVVIACIPTGKKKSKTREK